MDVILSNLIYQVFHFFDRNKGQASNPKKYRGKKQPQKFSSLESETETDFQGRCTDLEGYTFDLGPRAFDKFARTMKEL